MPHLSDLQKKHADKGLTIIGVTAEDPRNSLEQVEAMVADKGDTMAYTVAWDDARKTNDAYMKAAKQNGIPCAFIVDGNGKIAYIGHPMYLDEHGAPRTRIVNPAYAATLREIARSGADAFYRGSIAADIVG